MGRTKKLIEVEAECCPSVLAAPLTEAEAGELASAFAALADPVRLRLLSLVAAADEVCSCDLEAPLGRAQPTVSHHTKALAEAGLIVGEKRGRWMWWRIVPERLDAVREALS
ncbi:MAG TPA: metalloregulator ArsR/SmtB family transcription factor [Acidimicrobiales bacterium]|jgi:ArsR family transcriptional regulator